MANVVDFPKSRPPRRNAEHKHAAPASEVTGAVDLQVVVEMLLERHQAYQRALARLVTLVERRYGPGSPAS